MPNQYRPNELPLIGAITAEDIKNEISALRELYPEKDELALIRAVELYLDRKHAVDVLSGLEKQFDAVEHYATEIPKLIREFDNDCISGTEFQNLASGLPQDDAGKVIIYAYPLKIDAITTLAEGNQEKSNYKPLLVAYKDFRESWKTKKGNEQYPLLSVKFENPWEVIESFEYYSLNYSKEEKDAIISDVLRGLQSDNPGKARDEYVNKLGELSEKFSKLDYQASMHNKWKVRIDEVKDFYLKLLFQQEAQLVCEEYTRKISEVQTAYPTSIAASSAESIHTPSETANS
jgi:hypothetical protein